MPPAVHAGRGLQSQTFWNCRFSACGGGAKLQAAFAARPESGAGSDGLAIAGDRVTEAIRWGSADFPEYVPFWRRAGKSSLTLGAAAVLGITASAYFGIGYWRYERLVTADQMTATNVQIANADLQQQMAQMRDRLAATERALDAAQGRISSISDESQRQQASADQSVATKSDKIGQLQRALEQAQRELHMAEAQRVTLLARLSKAEADFAEGLQKQQQSQAGIAEWQKKVQQLTNDRDKANAERDQMQRRIEQLEQKLSARQRAQTYAQAQQRPVLPAPVTAAPAQPAVPQPAPAAAAQVAATAPAPQLAQPAAPPPVPARIEPQQQAVAMAAPAAIPAPAVAAPAVVPAVAVAPTRASTPAVAVVNGGRVAQLERVLASTGVDVKRLFAQFGVNRGEGGPFIPVSRGSVQPETMSAEKVAALGRLVKALPVSAPLDSYELGSPFGVRGDPINGHAAYHTGVDFRAPYESPVYATAPGVVTFSGFRNDYGRIVEIDHGNGLTTRYGHLHRAIVSVGQRVSAHMQIGYLGSSGRATGPHVHYEVLVNGEPQDPQKFISLGRLVPVVAHQ